MLITIDSIRTVKCHEHKGEFSLMSCLSLIDLSENYANFFFDKCSNYWSDKLACLFFFVTENLTDLKCFLVDGSIRKLVKYLRKIRDQTFSLCVCVFEANCILEAFQCFEHTQIPSCPTL